MPSPLQSEEELYNVALRALARRAHSIHEMRRKLGRYTHNELLVRVVLARLKENGHLDDRVFARQFTSQRIATRKQGPFRITHELRARGVSDADIHLALAASAGETDQAAVIRQRIERKLKSLRGAGSGQKVDSKKVAAIYGSLLRAGFPADLIRRELKRLTSAALPDTDPSDLSS